MHNITVKVIEFNEDFVLYEYVDGGARAMSGRKHFPNVQAGQTWTLTLNGMHVENSELIKDV